jgi:hypothetical protein
MDKEFVSFPYFGLGVSRSVRKDGNGFYGVVVDWMINLVVSEPIKFDSFEEALIWAKEEEKNNG